jgi:hypothetical protein
MYVLMQVTRHNHGNRLLFWACSFYSNNYYIFIVLLFETSLICTVWWKGQWRECIRNTYTHNLCFTMKRSLKYTLVGIVLFLPSLPVSNPPSLHYFMPLRSISCSTFTICCNKHNQHLTVNHNSQSFCSSTVSRLAFHLKQMPLRSD